MAQCARTLHFYKEGIPIIKKALEYAWSVNCYDKEYEIY